MSDPTKDILEDPVVKERIAKKAQIGHDFSYHAPTGNKKTMHESLRTVLGATADVLVDLVPPGRERATAITKLEEAMFWGNAGIARLPEVVESPFVESLKGKSSPLGSIDQLMSNIEANAEKAIKEGREPSLAAPVEDILAEEAHTHLVKPSGDATFSQLLEEACEKVPTNLALSEKDALTWIKSMLILLCYKVEKIPASTEQTTAIVELTGIIARIEKRIEALAAKQTLA